MRRGRDNNLNFFNNNPSFTGAFLVAVGGTLMCSVEPTSPLRLLTKRIILEDLLTRVYIVCHCFAFLFLTLDCIFLSLPSPSLTLSLSPCFCLCLFLSRSVFFFTAFFTAELLAEGSTWTFLIDIAAETRFFNRDKA